MEWPLSGCQSLLLSPENLYSDLFSSSFTSMAIINFNNFYNFISKFVVLSKCDRRSSQEDLRTTSDWSVKWQMPFNMNKWQLLRVGSRKIYNDYEMCGLKIKSINLVKDLGVTVFFNFKFSQQCNMFVKKTSRMMGLIKIFFSLKNKDVLHL